MSARSVAAALAAVALLALAGCGGSSQPAATAGQSPETEGAATAASTGSTDGEPVAAETASTGVGADGEPAIIVSAPSPGDRVTSPVRVAGTADVFEANVVVSVLDAAGTEIATDFTTATCGTGCRGDFELTLPFDTAGEQEGTVVVEEPNAAGGPPRNIVRIPVTLAP